MAPNTLFSELPEFEGRDPIATELSMSGAVDRRTRPFHIDEHIVLVVEAVVTGVEHKETKGGIVRSHKLKVGDAYELGGERKTDLLEVLHDEYVAFEDEMKAREPIDFTDPDPYGQGAAAGEGPEARAAYRAELDEIEAWANNADTLEEFDSSEEALAALTVYADTVRDDWESFDPAGSPEHVILQELRDWAQDQVASGDFPDEDTALVALAEYAAEEPVPADAG